MQDKIDKLKNTLEIGDMLEENFNYLFITDIDNAGILASHDDYGENVRYTWQELIEHNYKFFRLQQII